MDAPENDRLVSRAEIAVLAGVKRPAVSNWERRHRDFPRWVPGTASDGTEERELFRATEILAWLEKRAVPANARRADEPAGTSYGDRFRAALGAGERPVGEARPPAADPHRLLRAVNSLLGPEGAVLRGKAPPAAYMELLLTLLYVRGRHAELWSDVARHAAADPDFRGEAELAAYLPHGVPDSRIAEIVRVLDTHGTGDPQECAAAFEYVIERYVEQEGRQAGDFLTPRSVVRTVVGLATSTFRPRHVHDPFCRAGEFLSASAEWLREQGQSPLPSLSGTGSNAATLRLARMNVNLRGLDADLRPGPGLPDASPAEGKFDLVLTNPPFNVKTHSLPDTDEGWRYGPPPRSKANFGWLQHVVASLTENGRAAVIMPDNASFSANSREASIRAAMVEDGAVDCLIALPPQLFSSTAIRVTVWLLKRPTGTCDEILFVNAVGMGAMISRTVRALSDDERDSIVGAYRAWKEAHATGTAHEGVAGLSRPVGIEEIRSHDYALSPSGYVQDEPLETTDPAQLVHLTTRLAQLHRQAQRVDDVVERMLEEYGA